MSRCLDCAVFVLLSLHMAACAGGVTSGSEGEAPFDDVVSGQGEASTPTFEEFKRNTVRLSDTGAYVVNGDEVMQNDEELYAFWAQLYGSPGGLTVVTRDGVTSRWSDADKRQLTYCVNNNFGSNKATVVESLRQASDLGWERFGDVNFIYLPAEDANCTTSNPKVKFIVTFVNNPKYSFVADAPYPHFAKAAQQLHIYQGLGMTVPVLKHELGHVLGFVHEHTRPEAGACFEAFNWRGLTVYDSASIMHYANCGAPGRNTEISALDAAGVAYLYGAAAGYSPPAAPTIIGWGNKGAAGSGTFPTNANQMLQIGRYNTAKGSQFTAKLSGTGNFDLYVRFDAAPTLTTYDCRSNSPTSDEVCSMAAKGNVAHVAAIAKTGGDLSTNVRWTEGRQKTESFRYVAAPSTGIKWISTPAEGTSFPVVSGGIFTVRQTPTIAPTDTDPGSRGIVHVRFGPTPFIQKVCGSNCDPSLAVPAGKTTAQLGMQEFGVTFDSTIDVSWVTSLPSAVPTCTISLDRTSGTYPADFKASWNVPSATSCSVELDSVNLGTVPCANGTKTFVDPSVGSHKIRLRPINSDGVHGVCERSFTVSGSAPLPTCNLTGPSSGTLDGYFTTTYSTTNTDSASSCSMVISDSPINDTAHSCNGLMQQLGSYLGVGKHVVTFTARGGGKSATCTSDSFNVTPSCTVTLETPNGASLGADSLIKVTWESRGATSCSWKIDTGSPKGSIPCVKTTDYIPTSEFGLGDHVVRVTGNHDPSGVFKQCVSNSITVTP